MRPVNPEPNLSTYLHFILLSLSLRPLLASANWRYRSRPDLSPPTLNNTIPATNEVEKGYIFIAPFSGFPDSTHHGPLQPGPYIFTDTGELVWSGFTYFSVWAANFQVARYRGQDVLFCFEGKHNAAYGHGHGHVTFLDQHYETVLELRAGNHRLMDKHEFHIIDEKTALIQIYHPVPYDLRAYGGSEEQQWIVDARFQELDIATGAVLFEWSSLDHVDPSHSVLPLNPNQAGSGHNSSDAWDYFHINSVDKDPHTGAYLISARNANAIYKINGTTSAIIWELSNTTSSSNFTLSPGVAFGFQHHARFLPSWTNTSANPSREIISLFDNSAHGTETGRGSEIHLANSSSGKIICLDHVTRSATLLQAFYPPSNTILAKSQGSTHILPNGNALLNWGSAGSITEFTPTGKAIFHAALDSGALGAGIQNYRAFRGNWTGVPNEKPAIVALEDVLEGRVEVFVSWNGDTRTRWWLFYAVHGGKRIVLGEVAKEGFETSFAFNTQNHNHGFNSESANAAITYQAEAYDARNRVLTTTEAVKPDVLIRQFRAKDHLAEIGSGGGVSTQHAAEEQKALTL
ncbi:MAG: hypothetical protein Q9160_002167 [Pyrenula sp. 1 TL-2023]